MRENAPFDSRTSLIQIRKFLRHKPRRRAQIRSASIITLPIFQRTRLQLLLE